MKAKVRGFRGCEEGDVEINPIALVAGLNGAGKSSLLQAIAAACTNQPIPFFRSAQPDKPILLKGEAKMLLRGGMEIGTCTITVEDNTGAPFASKVEWPELKVSGTGKVHCSLIAAGLVNPMEMLEADRQRFFSTLLKADPTIDDLRKAIGEAIPELADPTDPEELKRARKEAPDGKTPMDTVVAPVEMNGWDVSWKATKERGAKRKGAWEAKSGETYGSKKAAAWKPKEWRPDLEGVSLEDLGTRATEGQDKVEAAIRSVAMEDGELERLRSASEAEAEAWNGLQEAEGKLKTAKEALRGAEDARQKIVIPTAIACPGCGVYLNIAVAGKSFTVAESDATNAQIEQAKAEYEAAGVTVQTALTAVETAQAVYTKASNAYFSVKDSGAKYQAAKEKTGSQDAVDVARDFLSGVLRDKAMVEAFEDCTRLAGQVAANQKLIDILAPEGLRRQKLQKALAAFNKGFLGSLSSHAGYSTVTIDDELEILYGGRRYFLLSESEKYRVRAVVQIAVALYDKSPLVIFDGADILDQEGRNGLFNMMQAADSLKFLVGMTVLAKKNVPDLEKAEMGKSYWVAEGTVAPLVAAA